MTDSHSAIERSLHQSIARLNELTESYADLRNRYRELIRHVEGRDLEYEEHLKNALQQSTQSQVSRNRDSGIEVYVTVSHDLGATAAVAARVFESYVLEAERESVSIGISGGRTIAGMMECVKGEYDDRLQLVPLSGSRLPKDVRISVNTIIGRFCSQRGRETVSGLQLPLDPRMRKGIPDKTYEELFESELRSYYLYLDGEGRREQERHGLPVHYAFTGVGSLDATSAVPRMRELLRISTSCPREVVGDMLDWPIDANGKVVDYAGVQQAIVGIRPDQLIEGYAKGNLKKIVVVAGAGGLRDRLKDEAICAAWRGGLFDVLVTDRTTAEAIIERLRMQT
ncbi:MAG: hypothetical protein GTO55_09260 [Armatimonadetes bacterium]|nr:hypothetical protein [Armatimonadota bacterium]NIM24435.1 hypothetical protein [Armatimonadota bacterium]NIM68306.1 hypothetical protein [Armatimonadota bacterium]NIM76710.1 hypothetical protein [Armatimonadota bacterium]NIN06509.1 hypothetical protein [Armatimonadota bacterium]